MALATKDAAVLVKDADAPASLFDKMVALAADEEQLRRLSENIRKMALPNSAEIIAKEVINLAKTNETI